MPEAVPHHEVGAAPAEEGGPLADGAAADTASLADGATLAEALVLAETPGARLVTSGWGRGDLDAADLDLRGHGDPARASDLRRAGDPARASQDAIVLAEGFERVPAEAWPSLFAACREAVRPDGTFVVRVPRGAPVRPLALRAALARDFDAVELFAWDGVWRLPWDGLPAPAARPAAGSDGPPDVAADLFSVCRPFQPYHVRSLELLRPRVTANGPEWRSAWLCERPELPERFLLRATVELLGERPAGAELRFRFLAPGRARLRLTGSIRATVAGTAELLLASSLAHARGPARWEEVERVAVDLRTASGAPLEARLSDVRIAHGERLRRRAAPRTSVHLREDYDAEYYRDMSGYAEYRAGSELRERANVHRAYALLAAPAPARAVDVGCGRGELARHLLAAGSEVTLLDYSPVAMGLARDLIGEQPRARFVVDDAANLAAHVPAGSQEAIFMTDFVEHLSVAELRPVLHACRRALAPHGALVVHTPERYSGAVVTAKAIHGLHVTLYEIDTLAELLGEAFGAVEVCTWDGFERFDRRGHCIELFALAWPEHAPPARSLPVAAGAAVEDPRLPPHFLLDATVDVPPSAMDGQLEIAFETGAGEQVARAARELSRLATTPVHVRLASELLAPEGGVEWAAVERVAVSAPAGTVALTDVSVRVAQAGWTGCEARHVAGSFTASSHVMERER
jgi:SAM-dependent methyltransferase